MSKSKDNKTFLLLPTLGIVFVVLGHVQNSPAMFMNNVFPYYSFHMALFCFISGYFFKDTKFFQYLLKK